MTDSKRVRISLYLDKEFYDRCLVHCQNEYWNFQTLARTALKEYLDNHGEKNKEEK